MLSVCIFDAFLGFYQRLAFGFALSGWLHFKGFP